MRWTSTIVWLSSILANQLLKRRKSTTAVMSVLSIRACEYIVRACLDLPRGTVPVDHIIMPCLATLPNCAHLTELKPRFRALKCSNVARLALASPHTLHHQEWYRWFRPFRGGSKTGRPRRTTKFCPIEQLWLATHLFPQKPPTSAS